MCVWEQTAKDRERERKEISKSILWGKALNEHDTHRSLFLIKKIRFNIFSSACF